MGVLENARKKGGFGGFHREREGIPTRRRGVQILNQGVWGVKKYERLPVTKCGVSKGEGAEDSPSHPIVQGPGAQDAPRSRKNPQ